MNVLHIETTGDYLPCNQDGAMTIKGLFLGAHQGDSVFLCSFQQTIQALPEQVCPREPFKLHSTVFVH